MALLEMIMPKMGESIFEGTILAWLKKEGEAIEEDESILEVATDKVDTEVPSLKSGVLKKILVKEGEVAKVGQPIALIEVANESESDQSLADSEEKSDLANDLLAVTPTHTNTILGGGSSLQTTDNQINIDERFYSPLVRAIAKAENIDTHELARIPGTGKDGRVTKADMFHYIKSRDEVSQKTTHFENFQTPGALITGGDEIIEMDRMRKMISERMLESQRISATVTSFVEADLTNLVIWRNKIKDEYQQREGEKITFTPIFVQAIARALRDFPMINISVDGERIIKKKDINVGVAVALPSGNLIVPVIKNADQLSLIGLSKKVNELANRGRKNQLNPEDLTGGTYTLSNIGPFGNIMGTPIIMQPQVAILAVGTIVKKPAVLETPTGDVIAIRHKMYMSHSYDHRVVDGALGGMFVRRVADYLEAFDIGTSLW
ncbi:Dihydrolipoamide acyltransferase component of branched-chain alpha-keto acid dehydrogenase complex [Lunatimonas lonarensis]|uniref:Dihydrolipoamide acetyltransferase component of pyruvate dehydrogenase complex n=1 Tax=Lunatimonas lonarensis TaxID=1232681 RepID=R7ZX88_9BACT|nr:dihydrolipoamide acetyltransferase family protein [Lunatimonas lonarensis]EON78618.1 Dihydrolipoamide acyltransferase component of branched-chain alpha-keto acid dehydrogenase complex [Lunatimonas lonarensis]